MHNKNKLSLVLVAASLAASVASADTLVLDPITFRDNAAGIEPAIVSDCALPATQTQHLLNAAAGLGLVAAGDGVEGKRHLKVEITNAVASGNAFIGHHKMVQLHVSLMEGNKEVASFDPSRQSGGGMGGGFMNSCAVLHRCTKTLAQDVTKWLKKQAALAAKQEQ